MGIESFATNEEPWIASKKLTNISATYGDEKTGMTIALSTGKVGFSVGGPILKMLAGPVPKLSDIVMIDVDVFTSQATLVDKVDISIFQQSNLSLFKRKIEPIFSL